MPADFKYSESNSSAEVVTDDITNINFGSIDSCMLEALNNPVKVNTTSYEKYIRAKFVNIVSGEKISNIKFWKDSGFLSKCSIKASANQTYSTPSNNLSTKALLNVPTSEGNALILESTESADPTVIDPSQVDHTGYTTYIVLQWHVDADASSGAIEQQIFKLSYDEGI